LTIYVYSNFPKHGRYIEAFSSWCGGSIRPISSFIRTRKLPKDVSAVAMFGIKGDNFQLLQHCTKNDIPFYYMDHPYITTVGRYKRPYWFRVTKNGLVQNKIVTTNSKRYLDNFSSIDMLPYEKYRDRDTIAIFPPSDIVSDILGLERNVWLTDVIDKVKLICPEKVIEVRYKYKNNTKPQRYEETLDQLLDRSYCVISFSSNVALEALVRGIPVVCSKECAAYPISNKIEDLNNLYEYDREPLFQSLAYGQYTINELLERKKNAFETFRNYQQRL
jgi:hypothetical protein